MRFRSLPDIKVWVQAKELCVDIYGSLKNCKDYGFRDQIQRASVSIMNNIAEGSFRKSEVEFYRYLEMANSSNTEVKSMLYLCVELGYLSEAKSKELFEKSESITKMIASLQNKLI